jgi:sugar/nucleoside kinase (ribokinase family)
VASTLDGGEAARGPRARLVRAQPTVTGRRPPVARDIDLLVVGEINPDVVVTDPDPRPVFGQVERLVEDVRLTIGSSSAITACGAARLGLRVAMVGVVGDDPLGRFMLDALTARGVDVDPCRVSPDRPTGASVILGNGTDRAILTARGTIGDVGMEDVSATLLARARHVHVGSFFLQSRLARDVPALFHAAREAGATTSIDPNWDPSGSWDGGFRAAAAAADVVLPNAAEVRRLTGLAGVEDGARDIAEADVGGRGRTVAVKLGADGALCIGPGGEVVRADALPVTPVDTTGAGDSFDAGFLAGWLDERPLEEVLRLAAACGSLSTRAVGGTEGQPTREEAEAAALASSRR